MYEKNCKVTCPNCGSDVPRSGKRGHPRVYCARCLPSVAVIGSVEYDRRLRALKTDRVAALEETVRELRARLDASAA